MLKISREYHFCASHMLEGHPKCGRMHGHNYKVVVTLGWISDQAPTAMLLDFGDMDKVINPIVDALDHRLLLSYENHDQGNPYIGTVPEDEFYLETERSTAECIAMALFDEIQASLNVENVGVICVDVWETGKSRASYERPSS